MDIEFIGPFSDAQERRIRDALHRAGGPCRMISAPRWTLFADQIGSHALYMAVDNRSGHTVRGDSVIDLAQQLNGH